MRGDMSKVIVERPRWGGSRERRRGRVKMRERGNPEDAPVRESIGKGRRTKGFNENLAPLKRYLLSQVGRPWDRVYAEICANLRLSSTVQRHVLQHLRDMVVLGVVMDGRTPRSAMSGREIWAAANAWRWIVYVCPKTGLLRRTPARPRGRGLPAGHRVLLAGGSQLQRIRGAWYHVVLAELPPLPRERRLAVDAVLGYRMDRYWQVRELLVGQHGREDVYAVSMRPAGKDAPARLLPEDKR
jgi:hypothetical protein